MKDNSADMIISGASELVTLAPDGTIEIVKDGWLAIQGERIVALGDKSAVTPWYDENITQRIDARGKVVAPGFVDCHTHLVFGGSRVNEYAAGLTAAGALELKKKGVRTGIHATVEDTRGASAAELFMQALSRLDRMLAAGTTTVESKSGYGLSTEAEIKILEVNRQLKKCSPVDLSVTFLGAHGWPLGGSRKAYMDVLINEMIPRVAELGLAQFCDVWCDEGYYSAEEAADILNAALDFGLRPKIHTDAYSYIGGSDLAAGMKMLSADHLNYTPAASMRKLAEADVVGVLLPALDFAVQHKRPFDYLQMKEQGMTVALATNLCPGCWLESMQLVMVLACRLYQMSPEEALLAATIGGAKALGLDQDCGSLEIGKYADIQIWDVPHYAHVIYRLGGIVVDKVLKKGRIVAEHPPKDVHFAIEDGAEDGS